MFQSALTVIVPAPLFVVVIPVPPAIVKVDDNPEATELTPTSAATVLNISAVLVISSCKGEHCASVDIPGPETISNVSPQSTKQSPVSPLTVQVQVPPPWVAAFIVTSVPETSTLSILVPAKKVKVEVLPSLPVKVTLAPGEPAVAPNV